MVRSCAGERRAAIRRSIDGQATVTRITGGRGVRGAAIPQAGGIALAGLCRLRSVPSIRPTLWLRFTRSPNESFLRRMRE